MHSKLNDRYDGFVQEYLYVDDLAYFPTQLNELRKDLSPEENVERGVIVIDLMSDG